jgi:hypothetical protein
MCSHSFWHWIVPALTTGVASSDAFDGQPDAPNDSVPLDGLDAIGRTVWFKPTHLKLAYRPEDELVNSNPEDENGFHFQVIRQVSVLGKNSR